MKSAAISIDITPAIGLPMGGNVRDDNLSRGTHDHLFCNVIFLENEGEKICFLGFDLLGVQYDACRRIKGQIEKKTGISAENIVISATHTHSGPDVTDIFKDRMDDCSVKYLENMAELVSDGVESILVRLEDMRISVSKKNVYDLSFNRRLVMKEGPMRMNWEGVDPELVDREAGPIDPELYVVSIYDAAGKVKAVMVNYTLHPAVLVGKDWLWSRDYINYLDASIKARFGEDVTVFFANGAEGNINHINFRDMNQGRGFEEAKRIGELLGEHVNEMLQNAEIVDIKNKPLTCISKEIELPLRPISIEDIDKAKKLLEERGDIIPSLLDGVPDEIYAREIIKLSKLQDKLIKTEIQAVKLGETVIVTLPGEVFVEYGLKIKSISPFSNTLIFGMTNDYLGYIPTQAAFTEGGYEIKTAASSKLDEMAGDRLIAQISELIKSL